eukprot:m.421802 g.421802  ORF g.421802 m.421802 type:complete len:452 (-) comp34967_c0_seq1:171-1526(-)
MVRQIDECPGDAHNETRRGSVVERGYLEVDGRASPQQHSTGTDTAVTTGTSSDVDVASTSLREDDAHCEQARHRNTASPTPPGSCLRRAKALAKKYNLVLCFLVAITVGLVYPLPGVVMGAKQGGVRPFVIVCIALIFLLMGAKLKQRDAREAAREWHGLLYGFTAILVFTVILGVLILRGVTDAGGFPDVNDFSTGMKIFFAVPTTINVGIVVSEQAGGNGATSLVLTTGTNLIGVFTVPLMLSWISDLDANGLDAGRLILRLVYSMLLPCVVGQGARQSVPAVRRFVDAHPFGLKITSSVALACLPWMSISRANEEGKLRQLTAASVFAVVGYFLLIHALLVGGNMLCSRLLRLSPPCTRSVVIMASQKSFPVAATIISFLPESVGDEGLMLIACILCQQTQLFTDSVFVGWWGLPPNKPATPAPPPPVPVVVLPPEARPTGGTKSSLV